MAQTLSGDAHQRHELVDGQVARDVAVMCFGEAGTPTTFASARASTRRIGAGQDRLGIGAARMLCPTYLVAARAS